MMTTSYKEKPFDWRSLLTKQSPPIPEIPRNARTAEEYVSEFEMLNKLVPTRKWDLPAEARKRQAIRKRRGKNR